MHTIGLPPVWQNKIKYPNAVWSCATIAYRYSFMWNTAIPADNQAAKLITNMIVSIFWLFLRIIIVWFEHKISLVFVAYKAAKVFRFGVVGSRRTILSMPAASATTKAIDPAKIVGIIVP